MGFGIPGFQDSKIPDSRFQIPDSKIPDSRFQDSKDFRFHGTPGPKY
ncbi:MAG: hypothetical protein IPJ30_20370 [Acidobacteria bacterium]|nr:hypothetical protein [Acidobacteriota bacterium]